MDLQFNGQELIPKSKDEVWRFVNDPASIAGCLPDVTGYEIRGEHAFDATVQVAVGPVRGKLKFNVLLEPAPDGEHMSMKIGGGGFGSVVDLLATADLHGDGASTTLDWQGTASVRGPIATVGGRVLDAQARRVIATTFSNVKSRLAGQAAPA